MDNIDFFKLLQSPALIILAAALFLMFTKKEYFSKLGRESTARIFSYTFYAVLVMAIVSAIVPVLNAAVGGQYTAMLLFSVVALFIVSETIKKLFIQDKTKNPLIDAIIRDEKIEPEIEKTERIKDNNDLKSLFFCEYNNNETDNKINNNKSNIVEQVNELLLYKKAMTENSSEAWFELIQATEDNLDEKHRINILHLALQRDSIKDDFSNYIRILSKLGNVYLECNEPLKAINAFEQSLAVNAISICPSCLVSDCISLGKSYAAINKMQVSIAMFEKARTCYITITDNPDIELDQEAIDMLSEVCSKFPSPASQPS